jgi:iron complex transport system ATP-binding protein
VLKSLTRVGCTVVVVLHDLVLASLYADRVVVLREGRVLSHDTPERALSCTVLEAAFDTRFSVRRDNEGLPVVLPCARDDQWRSCDVRCS